MKDENWKRQQEGRAKLGGTESGRLKQHELNAIDISMHNKKGVYMPIVFSVILF